MCDRGGALELDEAVELGHAWVQTLADGRGIRVLFVTGPALERHGLRDARASHDVEVLVEPQRYDELCSVIAAAGWKVRPQPSPGRTTLHTQVYRHQDWPCDLDVHSLYPGFLYDPAIVFDELWARHEKMSFAHRPCRVPDRVSGILILALHSLRGSSTNTGHADELEQLVRVPFTDEERAHAGAVALATGCTATLDTVLPRLGIHVDTPATDLSSPALQEWREQTGAGTPRTSSWRLAGREAPMRVKVRAMWASIRPRDDR
ncbi:hypothetical protein ASD65_15600 [Microbacterium sp. Root61]|uniref:nucleotidyltransferase family protein n=1 Tax=Microbacterium sp. Root61 TaxID=1736570 RepID=UPI0006F5975C|nr:nucleotidyltransferase family protein [Microbacterium sp. Root61]KRA25687.1 hypothetical protein ASD65_15600 [Microbacterium sp. Root61]